MKYQISLLVLVVLLGSACAHHVSATAAGEREILQQREHDFLAALGTRDLEKTTAYFADDATLHVANMPPIQGRSAIAQFYGNAFRFLQTSEAIPGLLRVSGSADFAYSAGRVSNVFEGAEGRVEYAGKYLLVWENQAGEWVIVFYSISNNQADTRR